MILRNRWKKYSLKDKPVSRKSTFSVNMINVSEKKLYTVIYIFCRVRHLEKIMECDVNMLLFLRFKIKISWVRWGCLFKYFKVINTLFCSNFISDHEYNHPSQSARYIRLSPRNPWRFVILALWKTKPNQISHFTGNVYCRC